MVNSLEAIKSANESKGRVRIEVLREESQGETLFDIPLEAYEYVVNGKSAIEWLMERYQVTKDNDSGITNDPNDWAREQKQPRYIVDLLKRVVRVSLEPMRIVGALPALNERATNQA